MEKRTVFQPELLLREGELVSDQQIEVDEKGVIAHVGPASSKEALRLPGEALLPGMVNAHSHAFQRGLRGVAEAYPVGYGSFWTWREAMYRLANDLDESSFRRLSFLAFHEMLRAGITTVGEFHYLHHEETGGRRAGQYGFDRALIEAAREAGIRLVLLEAFYGTRDIGEPISEEQVRFLTPSVDTFLRHTEALSSDLDLARESLGLVAHSVRAVPIEAIRTLHGEAKRNGHVFHMHVEEQPREVERMLAHSGKRPLELLLDRLDLGPEFTAVHCTHSANEDLERLIEAGASICLCPITEANLADGAPPEVLTGEGVELSLGSDSNLRIDFCEEMRLLEHAQRLAQERRGVFKNENGLVAARLFSVATSGGARSLGLRAGRLEPGYVADFFTLDLEAAALTAVDRDQLLDAFVFGCDGSAVRRTAVSGRFVYER